MAKIILIVDDSSSLRTVVRLALERASFASASCPSQASITA